MGQMMGQALNSATQGAGAAGAMAPPPPGAAAPPPLPTSGARWSLAVAGQTYGPYTDDQMRSMLASGQVAPSTPAWRPGASGWTPVSSYAEFAGGGHAAPPPPPAAG
jgi:hypothetical protein